MILVIIQARLSSSRLPAKALLPISGVPSIVISFRRASNTGLKTIIATSSDPSDDLLCEVLKKYNIPFFRGDLNNVLSRFEALTKGYLDSTTIVRLTGDNIFPDGLFIERIIRVFQRENHKYLSSHGEKSGLPYGTAVEVFYLKSLREAKEKAVSDFDKEHVTSFIRRKEGSSIFKEDSYKNMSLYRTTIDSLEDYLEMANFFSKRESLIYENMDILLSEFKKNNTSIISNKPLNNLIIGTVQWGIPSYGINHLVKNISNSSLKNIMKIAIDNGISYLDSGASYGNSEEKISFFLKKYKERLKVITKIPPTVETVLNECDFKLKIFENISDSMKKLDTCFIDILMFHRYSDLKAFNNTALEILKDFKNKKKIGMIGISIQSPKELIEVLKYKEVEVIQLPFNILDERWEEYIPIIEEEKKLRNLHIHARSIFLQGLLLTEDSSKWEKAHIINSKAIIKKLKLLIESKKCENIQDLCLRFVLSQSWIEACVIGVESEFQLKENIYSFNREPINILREERSFSLEEKNLNPSLWKK